MGFTLTAAGRRVPCQVYDRAFFDLQWQFATQVATLNGQPLNLVLLQYTNLYIRLGLGRDFNPENPGWLAYLAGLKAGQPPQDWTYHCYMSRLTETGQSGGPEVIARSGCFSCSVSQNQSLHLHFSPDSSAQTSLGRSMQAQRQAELQALFAQLSLTLPETTVVTGLSWLYNLQAYRRLFPASYLASARVIPARFHSLTLWGQFLNHQGGLRPGAAPRFLHRLQQVRHLEQLGDCFPLQVLGVAAVLRDFVEGSKGQTDRS